MAPIMRSLLKESAPDGVEAMLRSMALTLREATAVSSSPSSAAPLPGGHDTDFGQARWEGS
jgi:hypothetical protein